MTPNTTLSYGSEFKPLHVIAPLLHHHQHWPSFKEIIDASVSCYPLKDITETDQLNDITTLTARGNHKSSHTPENSAALNKAFNKEVSFEWAIPLLPHCIKHIPGASITPLGVAVQWSINEKGNRIIK